MKYSQLFVKTLNQPPKDADTINHKFLVQAGFVDQLMAGVYSYLPLGLRVLRKIEQTVREEMDAIGGQEILMPVLHPKVIWETTKGWQNIDVLFKLTSRTGKEYALGQSEEEVVTPLIMQHVKSYQSLPQAVYQINWKFRDELRSKSGILRGREFFMKDMYSFHETQKDFDTFYAMAKKAYLKVYERLGLVAKVTEASGGNFTEKISYEFMILTDAGEDDILYCTACEFCVNVEITKLQEKADCPKCGKAKLKKARASEAGNVFDLGQKYPKDFNLTYTAKDGSQKYPIMGCYGLGISRVMGILVEKFHDERGIIWPESIAPFTVHLVSIRENEQAEKLYKELTEAGVEVLYDDREDASAGQKFADADLIGIPVRLVVSKKTLSAGSGQATVELKLRKEKESTLLTTAEVLNKFKK